MESQTDELKECIVRIRAKLDEAEIRLEQLKGMSRQFDKMNDWDQENPSEFQGRACALFTHLTNTFFKFNEIMESGLFWNRAAILLSNELSDRVLALKLRLNATESEVESTEGNELSPF
jgi:hypothetical protein